MPTSTPKSFPTAQPLFKGLFVADRLKMGAKGQVKPFVPLSQKGKEKSDSPGPSTPPAPRYYEPDSEEEIRPIQS